MDLNVAVSTASELFEDGDMVFPILMGRENLKILASPGSESSGVSSLDAEEAKKLANEQLPSSSDSPTLVSEPNSTVQTESESSDGGSCSSSDDADDDKPSEQSPSECSEQSADEERSDSNDDEDDDNNSSSSGSGSSNDDELDDDSNTVLSKGDEKNDAKGNSFATIVVDGDNKIDIDAITTTTSSSSIGGGGQQSESIPAKIDDNATIDLDDEIRYKNLKIIYDGRDLLDFGANVANKSWNVQYAYLPEQNVQFFLDNRSQYNRLSAGFQDNPNHDYVLSKCSWCTFQYPLVLTDKNDQMPTTSTTSSSSLGELLDDTLAPYLLEIKRMECTNQHVSAAAQRNSPSHTTNDIDPTTLALLRNANNNSMNFNNNFMMNNPNRSQSMTYPNAKPILKNADVIAAVAAAATAAAGNSNHTCYKQNLSNNMNGTNAFYGNMNNNAGAFNTLINQLGGGGGGGGGNAMNGIASGNNMIPFDSSFMNTLNGGGHNQYGPNHGPSHNHHHQASNSNSNLNHQLDQQMKISALTRLMNRQQQQPQPPQQQHQHQWYGMNRHNINKSGINCNANSHKLMPTYSNF